MDSGMLCLWPGMLFNGTHCSSVTPLKKTCPKPNIKMALTPDRSLPDNPVSTAESQTNIEPSSQPLAMASALVYLARHMFQFFNRVASKILKHNCPCSQALSSVAHSKISLNTFDTQFKFYVRTFVTIIQTSHPACLHSLWSQRNSSSPWKQIQCKSILVQQLSSCVK